MSASVVRKTRTFIRRPTGGSTGGYLQRNVKIGSAMDPMKVEAANARMRPDVRSRDTIEMEGVQETHRVTIGSVGDHRDDDLNRLVKDIDNLEKLQGQIEDEEQEIRETQVRINVMKFEKKHGYRTGVKSGGFAGINELPTPEGK